MMTPPGEKMAQLKRRGVQEKAKRKQSKWERGCLAELFERIIGDGQRSANTNIGKVKRQFATKLNNI